MLLGRKAMTNINTVLKSRDITLLTKVCTVVTQEKNGPGEVSRANWIPKEWTEEAEQDLGVRPVRGPCRPIDSEK